MKKVLSIVLSLVMVICMMPVMAFADTDSAAYPDIAGEKCEGAVNVLSALGVIDGYEDGTYRPDETITRAELAKIVVTALGVADYASSTTSSYTDMKNAQWAIPYVEYATNLNLVNGYGDGRFGPSDPITYEQAATLIVRAIGFTDECNEMNGSWPAIYVQKATALGLFNDITNGGATGATRGDTSIMLYNALTVPQVYADNDGQTNNKYGSDGQYLTMMDTLNVNGRSEYKIVTSSDADTAVNSIAGYIGAAAEVIYNKDGDVLALSDIKTNFLTGEYKSNGKFEAEDGTTYTIAADAYKKFAKEDGTTTGKVEKADAVPTITNNISNATDADRVFKPDKDAGKTFTIAATVSGKTITGIYSIADWNITKADQVDDSDLTQIDKNQKLLSEKFPLNDDQEIDTTGFILNGVDSLDDIEADDVVYVYVGDNEITRIDVGTETVTGTISKVSGKDSDAKATIDGTTYEMSSKMTDFGDIKAGNEVTLYLDYSGKVFATDLVDGAAGNFAVVVTRSDAKPEDSNINGTAKVQLLTADGVTTYEINGKKYNDNDSLDWKSVTQGIIVQYSLNDDGQITKLITPDTGDYEVIETADVKSKEITKSGYLDGHSIADSALIFTVPTKDEAFVYTDTDELSTVKKTDVLDTDLNLVTYVYDIETNRIICMIMDDSATSENLYGIATSTYSIDGGSGNGADFYIGSEFTTDGEIDDDNIPATVKNNGGLYKITKTTSGSYKFVAASVKGSIDKPTTVKNGYVEINNEKCYFYDNVIVYIYDKSDDEYTIGSTSDLTDDELESAKVYMTGEDGDDSYGLIDYVVITMK